jgi:hypothetical protein
MPHFRGHKAAALNLRVQFDPPRTLPAFRMHPVRLAGSNVHSPRNYTGIILPT